MRKGQEEKGRGAPHPTCYPCITHPFSTKTGSDSLRRGERPHSSPPTPTS